MELQLASIVFDHCWLDYMQPLTTDDEQFERFQSHDFVSVIGNSSSGALRWRLKRWLIRLREFPCIREAAPGGGSEECCDNSDKRLIKGLICALAATDALHKSRSARLPTNKPHANFLRRWYAKRQWEEENNGCEFKLLSLQSTQPKRISNSSSTQARGGRAVQWHHLCVILRWLAYSATVFLG